mmetsp:Transcript_38798/g.69934  ORF Transcript_38798/g.69934 Transcript_38798/m.69934 type:complete len:245 (+) Transcript_38798:185-919(+)|eukprot:CAMPEP_0201926048 /NCGR_PEP_ID=MMETSP0903-20130614/15061_1 /ASSEMBLY_ACC=CAM_ASM_000552 /TAXON_ID=420261 /ORGANISM="Thalassiosira antarctica, Strain CCMP982" /LENGTH=244 /DNA_ID=CAMNT_0048463781 /DNA_START=129 /DNA_END=863 /DNA_ORIENTATION=-
MSETASFVDPVFLARFGLTRINAIDYFLHPLNPFRTQSKTSNEVLSMQGINIGTLMAWGTGTRPGPLPLEEGEDEYRVALSRLTGEQYELLPLTNVEDATPMQLAALFTIRHVHRTTQNQTKVLGMYYILEGVIYKSPTVRGLMKAHVTRTLEGLSEACDALSVCATYDPSTGYIWKFEPTADDEEDDDVQEKKQRKRRRILDNRRLGERTEEEEEGIRASEAIDRILSRLSNSEVVVKGKPIV